jgi:GR25 family glycosyltransferase involved in LPS biosynthesis
VGFFLEIATVFPWLLPVDGFSVLGTVEAVVRKVVPVIASLDQVGGQEVIEDVL